jgi:hypothetical protein
MPDVNASRETNEKWATAALRIFSEKLEVDEISALIGLKPTGFYTKGDPISARRPEPRHSNAWFLKSEIAEDLGLDVHLGWLVDLIESKVVALRTLRQTCKVDLFCGFSSTHGQGGTVLDKDLLVRLSALSLDLKIDLYPPGPIQDEEVLYIAK